MVTMCFEQSTFNTQPNGFTLVELLIVVAVIALLASLLLPALREAKESARTVQCNSLLRQISLATTVYANDYKDYGPPGKMIPVPGFGNAKGNQVLIGLGYLSKRLWNPGNFYPYNKFYTYNCPNYGHYPGETSYGVENGGYLINPVLSIIVQNGAVYYAWNDPVNYKPILRMPYPSQMLSWADFSGDWAMAYRLWPEAPPGNTIGPFYRHKGGLNVNFADGHVQYYHALQLEKDTSTYAANFGALPSPALIHYDQTNPLAW